MLQELKGVPCEFADHLILICTGTPPTAEPKMDIGPMAVVNMPGNYLMSGTVVITKLGSLWGREVSTE